MKYLSLLVLFTCLSLQLGFSQVKKQFLDTKNTKSTVVIKEDAANDMEILTSQFDINSFGMGQEIRITTAPPAQPKAEVALAEVPLAEVPQTNVPAPVSKKVVKKAAAKKVVKKKVVKKKRVSTKEAAKMPKVKKKPTEIYYKGIGKSSKKKVKMKKRKLVKRKKLKKRKYRKSRCFRF